MKFNNFEVFIIYHFQSFVMLFKLIDARSYISAGQLIFIKIQLFVKISQTLNYLQKPWDAPTTRKYTPLIPSLFLTLPIGKTLKQT